MFEKWLLPNLYIQSILEIILAWLEAKRYVIPGSTWLHVSPMNTYNTRQNTRERDIQRQIKTKETKLLMYSHLFVDPQRFWECDNQHFENNIIFNLISS